MKLAIIGSRTFNDYDKLLESLIEFFEIERIDEIISGGAKGADSLGERLAESWGRKMTVFEADWNKYGKSAGFIRNQQIIDACDIVLAFWDGKSKGTQDSINKAKLAKKPTFIVYF